MLLLTSDTELNCVPLPPPPSEQGVTLQRKKKRDHRLINKEQQNLIDLSGANASTTDVMLFRALK